jgi:hypothetical protein
MKKQFLLVILTCFLIVISVAVYMSDFIFGQESKNSWFDDFISDTERWNWGYNAGTGYKTITTIEGYSVVEGGVRDSSVSSQYSDCSLYSNLLVGNSEIVSVEIRMRYTDTAKGTKGCGWWDGSNIGDNVAWFCYFSSESDASMRGLRCQVRRAGLWYLNQAINVDITQWHVYQIDLLRNGSFFYIDGQLMASSPFRPDGISRLEGGWVDNGYLYISGNAYGRGNLDLDVNEKMFIDWVSLNVPSAQDALPPVTFDDYDRLWHNSDFRVTLTANDDLSGVKDTYYKINHGSIKSSSIDGQPAIVVENANNTLEYWSVDIVGNEELPHKFLSEIKLDKSAPIANAGHDQIVDPGTAATFIASSSTDNMGIISYDWNFGDGSTKTGISVTHSYSSAGIYTVNLTVEDVAGNTALKSVMVTVEVAIPEFSPSIYLAIIVLIVSVLTLLFNAKYKHITKHRSKLSKIRF